MKLVYIEWIDAHGVEPNWEWMEELLNKVGVIVVCKSVGFLVKETMKQVTIVPHVIEAAPHVKAQGCGDMTIPKANIVRLVVLTVPGPPRKANRRGVGCPRINRNG